MSSERDVDSVFDYLCIHEFLGTISGARALSTAFESGLIDALVRERSVPVESLVRKGAIEGRGMRLLLRMLRENGVVEERGSSITLTDKFTAALRFRDLMELNSSLAHLAAHDFLDHFPDFIFRPDLFPRRARYFRLFGYDRCFEHTEDNEAAARRWMNITTTLTRYEAPILMRYHDFGSCRDLLDIGGNSGELVSQLCCENGGLRASVFDLPLVCDIGAEHVKSRPGADRITFIRGNALTDDLPGTYDTIIFKSVLHDWPKKEAALFLSKAGRALEPGGKLLIFERGPVEEAETRLTYSLLPMLLFYHSFRSPEVYESCLREIGFGQIEIESIDLEMPFFLLKASK